MSSMISNFCRPHCNTPSSAGGVCGEFPFFPWKGVPGLLPEKGDRWAHHFYRPRCRSASFMSAYSPHAISWVEPFRIGGRSAGTLTYNLEETFCALLILGNQDPHIPLCGSQDNNTLTEEGAALHLFPEKRIWYTHCLEIFILTSFCACFMNLFVFDYTLSM